MHMDTPTHTHAHRHTHAHTHMHTDTPTRPHQMPVPSKPHGLCPEPVQAPFVHVRLAAGTAVGTPAEAPCPLLLDPTQPPPSEVTGSILQRRMFWAPHPAASRGLCHCGTPARGPRLRGQDVSPRLRGRPHQGSEGLRATPQPPPSPAIWRTGECREVKGTSSWTAGCETL